MKKEFKIILVVLILFLALFLINNFSEPVGKNLQDYPIKQALTTDRLGEVSLPSKDNVASLIIRGCTNINQGGYYYLEDDIKNNDNFDICFPISEEIHTDKSVVIDCRGHKIIETRGFAGNSRVIEKIFYTGEKNNYPKVTIKNCEFIGWFQAISLRTSNSELINNNFKENFYDIVADTGAGLDPLLNINLEGNDIRDNPVRYQGLDIYIGDKVTNINLIANTVCSVDTFNVFCFRSNQVMEEERNYAYNSNCLRLNKLSCNIIHQPLEE